MAEWVKGGLLGGQAQLQQVQQRESAMTAEVFPKLATIAELQGLLKNQSQSLMTLTLDPQQITDAAFWGQLGKLGRGCGFEVRLIEPGTELAKAQEQIEGHLPTGKWRQALFIRGERVKQDVEEMLTALFDDLVVRHSKAPVRPKPR